jgi:dUTP pyrophosphatase
LSKVRGFEVAKGFEDANVRLPERSTEKSAGYDFYAVGDVEIKPVWKEIIGFIMSTWHREDELDESTLKPVLVPTGVKAYMEDDEALFMHNRSSNPIKKFLLLTNGVGIVDSDYYNNPDNDGHIMFQFINFGFKTKKFKSGDKLGQGVFQKYLKADDDSATGERAGGHGSTGE